MVIKNNNWYNKKDNKNKSNKNEIPVNIIVIW